MFMIFLWKMFCKRSDLFIGWGSRGWGDGVLPFFCATLGRRFEGLLAGI